MTWLVSKVKRIFDRLTFHHSASCKYCRQLEGEE